MRYPTPYLSPCPSRYPGRFSASSHAETCRGRCRVSPSESPSLFAAIRVTVPLRPHPSHRPSPPPSESPSLFAAIRVAVPLRRHPSRRLHGGRRRWQALTSRTAGCYVLWVTMDTQAAGCYLLADGHGEDIAVSIAHMLPGLDRSRVMTVPES